MPVKIFIAAPWGCKDVAEEVSEKLQLMGCGITSRWHRVGYFATSKEVGAVEDLEDIDASQVLLLLDIKSSVGKYYEAGYAQGTGKPVIWWHYNPILADYPIYAYHPATINVLNWEDLFTKMLSMEYPVV